MNMPGVKILYRVLEDHPYVKRATLLKRGGIPKNLLIHREVGEHFTATFRVGGSISVEPNSPEDRIVAGMKGLSVEKIRDKYIKIVRELSLKFQAHRPYLGVPPHLRIENTSKTYIQTKFMKSVDTLMGKRACVYSKSKDLVTRMLGCVCTQDIWTEIGDSVSSSLETPLGSIDEVVYRWFKLQRRYPSSVVSVYGHPVMVLSEFGEYGMLILFSWRAYYDPVWKTCEFPIKPLKGDMREDLTFTVRRGNMRDCLNYGIAPKTQIINLMREAVTHP